MTNSGETAISIARTQAADGTTFGRGLCLQRVRLCYGVPALYTDAATAWRNAQYRHPQVDPSAIPRGVPVFWTGGSAGHGHIAIATGDGWCWSTDIEIAGRWAKVPITRIAGDWGLTFVGWTEDLNGVRLYDPTNQEDDMATPDEIWAETIKQAGDRHASVVLGQTWKMVAALAQAVQALAAGQDAAVQAAVRKALAEGVVDVDVNVNQRGA